MFKKEPVWVIDKWLQVIINKMLLKAVILTTKKLKNKAVLNLNQHFMCCYVALVMYSN